MNSYPYAKYRFSPYLSGVEVRLEVVEWIAYRKLTSKENALLNGTLKTCGTFKESYFQLIQAQG